MNPEIYYFLLNIFKHVNLYMYEEACKIGHKKNPWIIMNKNHCPHSSCVVACLDSLSNDSASYNIWKPPWNPWDDWDSQQTKGLCNKMGGNMVSGLPLGPWMCVFSNWQGTKNCSLPKNQDPKRFLSDRYFELSLWDTSLPVSESHAECMSYRSCHLNLKLLHLFFPIV